MSSSHGSPARKGGEDVTVSSRAPGLPNEDLLAAVRSATERISELQHADTILAVSAVNAGANKTEVAAAGGRSRESLYRLLRHHTAGATAISGSPQELLAQIEETTRHLTETRATRATAIGAAESAGVAIKHIASAAGVSRQNVYALLRNAATAATGESSAKHDTDAMIAGVIEAQEAILEAKNVLQERVRQALDAGVSARTLGKQLGLSRGRVYQIRDGK
jgi:DNA-binding phage protein